MSGAIPCLVLASEVTALGTLRCLARRPIPVLVATRNPGPAARSRWYRAAPQPPPDSPNPEVLADYLESLEIDRAVLVPGSDNWARAAAGLSDHLRERFPVSVAAAPVLDTLVDKARFAEVLERHGIPGPTTTLIPANDPALPDFEDGGDLFLKPTDSQAFFRTFGVKAYHVRNQKEARTRIRQAADAGIELIAQEYVPGPASAHVFVDGFVDRDGNLTGLLARRRLRMHPPDFGNSSLMVSIPLDEAGGAVTSVRRLLPTLGYRGIFSAEFKEDPRDGAFRLLEINARAWWYVEFAARCGVNTPWMAYRDALGDEIQPVNRYRTGVRLVYPEHDLEAYRHLRRRGKLGLLQWVRSWAGARQPILCLDDPGPGLHQLWATLKRKLPTRTVMSADGSEAVARGPVR